jgi:hypothetical protein
MNASMGLDGFTERAQRELQATGEKVRSHTSQPSTELTTKEDQIAQQARRGTITLSSTGQLPWHDRRSGGRVRPVIKILWRSIA